MDIWGEEEDPFGERKRKGKRKESLGKRRWVDDAPAATFNTQFGNSGVAFIVVLLTF